MNLPRMIPVRVKRECPEIDDLTLAVRQTLERVHAPGRLRRGERIAVTAGSRGIWKIDVILKAVIDALKDAGAKPFIVPAMGSHAGATAEGQKAFLAGYGVTEQSMGCPILSSMETVPLGESPLGVKGWCDRHAYEADGIVVVNRVKPHTGFSWTLGSGLLKMLAIGLGKHKGAEHVHQRGVDVGYGEAIRDGGLLALAKLDIRFGVAIVENAKGRTARIEAALPVDFEKTDERLLAEARQLMGRLPGDFLHLLIVDFMGKNISGTGMDPNVIGRGMQQEKVRLDVPRILRLFVRDLTPETHGNAIGIGFADFCTDRLVARIDTHATWTNVLASVAPWEAHVPIHYPSDRQCIETALATAGTTPPERMNIMRIRDTEHIDTLQVSETLFAELKARDDVEAIGAAQEMTFDADGNLMEWNSSSA
jgi:hypothetical protein